MKESMYGVVRWIVVTAAGAVGTTVGAPPAEGLAVDITKDGGGGAAWAGKNFGRDVMRKRRQSLPGDGWIFMLLLLTMETLMCV